MTVEKRIQTTASALQVWRPESERVTADGGYLKVVFPSDSESEYRILACLYDDGEVQIVAERNGAPEDEYFWHKSFEFPDYSSLDEMHQKFLGNINELLSHETRIVHRRGLFFGSFECAYEDADGWRSIDGHGYFRWSGIRVPPQECGNMWRANALNARHGSTPDAKETS